MINMTVLSGRLTADPRRMSSKPGTPVTTFTVAVTRPYKNADGTYGADFIDCVAWDKTADFIGKYFKKGDPIEVTGQLHNNNRISKDGTTKYGIELNVDRASFTITARPKDGEEVEVANDPAPAPEGLERLEE